MTHPYFSELRFLLHGSLDHYDCDDDLFIPDDSKAKDLWKVIADCILEPWQVIDHRLSPFIYSIKEQLKIKKLDRDDIIDRLSKDPTVAQKITPDKLIESQIIELLDQIYRAGESKCSLWKNLALHQTSEGYYVPVTGNTYLKSKYPVPKTLENKIIIIKHIQELDQDWITSWSSEIAIEKLIELLKNDSFEDKGSIASDLLSLLSASTSSQKKALREIQWVSSKSGLDYYTPEEVVILNNEVKELISEKLLDDLHGYGYCEISCLDTKYQSNTEFKNLCSRWSYKELLYFLFEEFSDPSNYSSEIYKILLKIDNTDLDDELQNLIKQDKEWITLKKSNVVITTDKIIYYKPLSTDRLTKSIIYEIVECLDKYYTPEACEIDIPKLHAHLKKLFITEKETLQILADGLKTISEFYIGNFDSKNFDFNIFLKILSSCENLPILKVAQVDRKIFEDYFLKATLKQISVNRAISVINFVIQNNQSEEADKVKIINDYLMQYEYPQQREILSSIKLLNQSNHWKSANELCDPKTAWNISKEYLLNVKKHGVLSKYLDTLITSSNDTPNQGNDTLTQSVVKAKDSNVRSQKLQKYFESWDVQGDLIGIFIWLLAGDDLKTQDLARNRYLSCAATSMIDNTFNPNSKEFNGQIQIKEDSSQTIEVLNLLGNKFKARRNQGIGDNLFIGSISLKSLVITSLNIADLDSGRLTNILKASIELICKQLFSHDLDSQVWEKIQNSWQLHTDVAKSMIIQDSRTVLKGFKIDNQDLTEKLDIWNDLYREHYEALHFAQSSNKSQIEIKNISEELANLITNDPSVQKDIYEAVGRRISDNGYALSSIPFELFQNADDATLEYQSILGQLEIERTSFYLEWNSDSITVYHSGRPINSLTHPNAQPDYVPQKRFKYDLFNMLSFHSSDKSEEETGKFGLGFKSVYLACSEPIVISDKLQFSIKGGLIPVSKPVSDIQVASLRRQKMYPFNDGTLVYLKVEPEIQVDDIFKDFKKYINLMLVFSKIIKQCTLQYTVDKQQQTRTLSWSPTNLSNSKRIQIGRVEFPDSTNLVNWKSWKLLCFNMTLGSLNIIIPKDLKKSYLEECPTLWVTAPTKEDLNLRFVINARFSLTTGRTSLDRNAKDKNCDLAYQLGLELFEVLEELFVLLNGINSKKVLEDLGIPNHKPSQLWEFLWDVLIIDWVKKFLDHGSAIRTSDRDLSIQIIQTMVACQDAGLGKLIRLYKVLPSGIRSNPLVCLQDVEFCISGFIAENSQILENILKNRDFLKSYPIYQIINSTIKNYLERLFGTQKCQEIRYANVLEKLIKNNHLSPAIAQEIYNIFNPTILKSIKDNHVQEHRTIESRFSSLKFKSLAGGFQEGSKLLTKEISSKEEKLLINFAPTDLILSHEYFPKQSLECFLAYRELLGKTLPEYTAQDLCRWCLQADTPDKQNGVINYLWHRGDLYQELVGKLSPYLSEKSPSQFWGKSNPLLKRLISEILQKDSRLNEIERSQTNSDEEMKKETRESTILSTEKILQNIYHWWSENRDQLIPDYERRIYPNIPNGSKITNGESKQRWMILFMLGMFHTMGRQKDDQHRKFLEHCQSYGWLDTFSESPSEYWIEVLDTYFTDPKLHRSDEVLEYYQWLKNYPGIFALSKWFDVYQQSFLELSKLKSSSWTFLHYLRPKTNLAFSGSGLGNTAPPIDKILGIGSNFILRELIRFGVISNDFTYSYAYVPSGRVRSFFQLLGCPKLDQSSSKIDYARTIYKFLEGKLGKEYVTFQNDFDIPFLILLRKENAHLRTQLLGEDLLIESPSDEDSVKWSEK